MVSFTLCPSDTATGPVGAFFGSRQSHVRRAPWQSSCLALAIFQKSPDSPQQETVFRDHNPSSRVLAALGCPCFWAFLLGNTINYSFKEKKKLLVFTISNSGLRLLGLLRAPACSPVREDCGGIRVVTTRFYDTKYTQDSFKVAISLPEQDSDIVYLFLGYIPLGAYSQNTEFRVNYNNFFSECATNLKYSLL